MRRGKSWCINAALGVLSLAVAIGATLSVDRMVGHVFSPMPSQVHEGLIFRPGTERSFMSVDFRYTARANSLGLREREIAEATPGVYRIAGLGDSFTYGWGVQQEATWLRQLEINLRQRGLNVETVNCGDPGTGPPVYAGLAAKVIPALKPDLVIVALFQGDDLASSRLREPQGNEMWVARQARRTFPNFARLVEKHLHMGHVGPAQPAPGPPPKLDSVEDNRRLAAKRAKAFLDALTPEQRQRFDRLEDAVKTAYLNGELNPYMIRLAMKFPAAYTFTLNLDDSRVKTLIQHLAGCLARIKALSEKEGANVIAVSVPHGPYVNEHAFRNVRRVGFDTNAAMLTTEAPDTAFRLACAQAGLPFFDVTRGFREERQQPGLYFELDGHFTAAGHKLFADLLAPLLVDSIRAAAQEGS